MTRSEFKTLAIQRILRLDGATGTELAKRGMPPGVCPEAWILDNPDAIIDAIHEKLIPIPGYTPTHDFSDIEKIERAKKGL